VIDIIIDRIDAFALRYRKPLAILGIIWLAVSWASSAHFLALPEIPFLTGKTGVFASSACATLWWAWLNPRISKRRAARDSAATKEAI
jgi:Na+/proline symporter